MPQALPYITAATGIYGATRGGGGSSTVTQELDPQTAAMQQDLYNRAKGIAQQPFIPYTGPQVAGFNPDQLRQFQATRGMFESGQAYDPTKALQGMAQEQRPMTGQAASLLGQDIGAYQSPYQQQVIDLAMGDIQRQADIARGSAQDRAIRAGAFGGSRSAVLEAESQRPYADAMQRTAVEGRQRGFEQAQQAAERDVARQQQMQMFAPELELRARQQQAGLLGGLQGQQVQGLGLLGQAGAQQQGLQQAGIGASMGEFQRALQYPQQQFGLLSQAVTGIPGQTSMTKGYNPNYFERLQSGLNAYQGVSNLFQQAPQAPVQTPQINMPLTLPGSGGYPS